MLGETLDDAWIIARLLASGTATRIASLPITVNFSRHRVIRCTNGLSSVKPAERRAEQLGQVSGSHGNQTSGGISSLIARKCASAIGTCMRESALCASVMIGPRGTSSRIS